MIIGFRGGLENSVLNWEDRYKLQLLLLSIYGIKNFDGQLAVLFKIGLW